MIRFIATIWQEQEQQNKVEESLARYHEHKQGRMHERPSTPSAAPCDFQTPGCYRYGEDKYNTRRRLTYGPENNSSTVHPRMYAWYSRESTKFSGTYQENLLIALTQFYYLCHVNHVADEDLLSLVHNILKNEALHYYYIELRSVSTWYNLIPAAQQFYDSKSRCRNIRSEQKKLTIKNFISNGCSTGETLQKLARKIEDLLEQFPTGENDD